jgi:hypothetical protein
MFRDRGQEAQRFPRWARLTVLGLGGAAILSGCEVAGHHVPGTGGETPSLDDLQADLANAQGRQERDDAARELYRAVPVEVRGLIKDRQLEAPDGLHETLAGSTVSVMEAMDVMQDVADVHDAQHAVREAQAQIVVDTLPGDLGTYADRLQSQNDLTGIQTKQAMVQALNAADTMTQQAAQANLAA